MMTDKYVVFDIDGVLADFPHSFSRLAATMYLVPTTHTHDVEHWDWLEIGGVSREEHLRVWDKVERSTSFWLDIPLLLTKNDLRAMYMLHEDGVQFIYLTNRHDTGTTPQQTAGWLHKHQLPTGELVFVKDKDKYLTERFEGNIGSILGVIEDSPKNLERYRRGLATKLWRPVVFVADRKYNVEAAPRLPRVSSVMDFCDRLLNYLDHSPLWLEELQDV
jgi:hypothetical protein